MPTSHSLFRFLLTTPMLIGWLAGSARDARACATAGAAEGPSRRQALRLANATFASVQASTPWGGPDPSKWRPEAVLANAVWRELARHSADPDVEETLVSAPVRMIFTDNRVYGDGQTNASLAFTDSGHRTTPQLVATLTRRASGRRQVDLRFAPDVQILESAIDVISYASTAGSSGRQVDRVTLRAQPDGSKLGEWTPRANLTFGDLAHSRIVWIRPVGWNSVFPMDFRSPILSESELRTAAGPATTIGLNPLDPLRIREKANGNTRGALMREAYDSRWVSNSEGGHALRNESIHGEISKNGTTSPTAIGGGHTWLVERGAHSAFKNLYTCFDARNPSREAETGLPSGGGWHEIGDAAETIINNLETGSVPVGFAAGAPASPPDGLGIAWDLTDVATVRMLKPGQAAITPAGDRTWSEDIPFRANGDGSQRARNPARDGRLYHWFFFPSDVPTCTQEWVHPCRPSEGNSLGLRC